MPNGGTDYLMGVYKCEECPKAAKTPNEAIGIIGVVAKKRNVMAVVRDVVRTEMNERS